MPPPAKRRKRNVVHDESEDELEEVQLHTNNLEEFLFSSSPETSKPKTSLPTRPAPAPQSPALKTKRPTESRTSKPILNTTTTNSGPPTPPRSLLKRPTPGLKDQKSTSASADKLKTRTSARITKARKEKTTDLKTLFSRQAEREKTSSPKKPDCIIIDDPISDGDDFDEDDFKVVDQLASKASHVGGNARKRFLDTGHNGGLNEHAKATVPASQQFLRPSRQPPPSSSWHGSTSKMDDHVNNHVNNPMDDHMDDQKPWFERFGPMNLDELAVHKKKVSDVRKWLEDVITGRLRQRLLILKGAAGTGKTTTIRLLAQDMGCELLEWRNSTGVNVIGPGFQSASAKFEEFMGRGGKFGQLDTDSDPASPTASASTGLQKKSDDGAGRMILIEEFPNTFSRSSAPLQSFRSTVLQYLAANTPSLASFASRSKDPITPVIMVISETLLTTASASADSFTAHRLLGPEITRHPGTAIIEFNPIAPTFLASALELIVKKEARKSGRKRTPGPGVLKRLGEIGDIRSAVSSLEFLCLKGDTDTDWGSNVGASKPKRGAKAASTLTRTEVESLELISRREATLGIFHAVGKVVYNKRGEAPSPPSQLPEAQAEILPPHLAHHVRPKCSEVSVDELMDETGTDIHTFISALHENYVLSCNPGNPTSQFSSVDYVNDCIEYLSESDLLCPSSGMFFGGSGRGGMYSGRDLGSHVLRQDEITFQVATRGILFSLPNPVKRIGMASSKVGPKDKYKMFYPTSLKTWREKEEIEGLLDHWSTNLLKGGGGGGATRDVMDGASVFRRNKNTFNSGNAPSSQFSQMPPPTQKSHLPDSSSPPPLLSLGSAARRELLLERLPYMAHIAQRRKPVSFTHTQLRDLERIVSFSGIDGTAVDEEEQADEAGDREAAMVEGWATDKQVEEAPPRKGKRLGIRVKSESGDGDTGDGSMAGMLGRGLVLSDDDIED